MTGRRHIVMQSVAGAVMALSTVSGVFAQPPAGAAAKEPEPINALRTPSSPAFTLLGVEPTSVDRPSSPADFAVAFINQAREFPSVPKNFAVETSPYWLVGRPTLTWRDDSKRTVSQSIARTTSLSIATAQPKAVASTTGVGVGVRTSLWSGHLTSATTQALTKLEQELSAQGTLFLALEEKNGMAELRTRLRNGQIEPVEFTEKQRLIAELVEKSPEMTEAKKRAAKRIQNLAVSREGFTLDVASAATWDFPDATFTARQFRKWGAWATAGYQAGHLTALGVFRVLGDRQIESESHVIEWGERAIYSTADSTLSVEYVTRTLKNGVDGKYRLVGIVEHSLTEGLWLTASFGRDRNRSEAPETLVAQVGISVNVSRERYQSP